MAEYGIDAQWKAELLSKNDIVSTVSSYVPLTKKGKTYWGRCPFHHEKTPSFAVDEIRQFYHCFGCGESGDSITFIMKLESLDFMGAIKLLAEKARMEIPSMRVDNDKNRELKEKRDILLAINKQAALKYHSNLKTTAGAKAKNYLINRGLDDSLIKKFGLGVSLNQTDILEYLNSQGFSNNQIKEAGIAEEKDGRYYDVFFGRMMVPIIDTFGSVVAFGGRLLEDSDFAKYRNTSNTLIFDKSKTVFAANFLKKVKQQKTLEYIILCEGYMDVIALHKAGFDSAVASMGTSLTLEQIKTLKRFCDNIVICYDGDAAGQKAALRAIDMLLKEGLEVKVIALKNAKDPDELIKKQGAAAFERCIQEAVTALDYKFNHIQSGHNLGAAQGKNKFTFEALEFVKTLDASYTQEIYLSKIRAVTGFTMESLKQMLSSDIKDDVKQRLVSENLLSKEQSAAKYLLHSLINREQYVDYELSLEDYLGDEYRNIYGFFSKKENTFQDALETLDGEEVRLLTELSLQTFNMDETNASMKESYYEGCRNCILTTQLTAKKKQLSADYDIADSQSRAELLPRILEVDKKLSLLNKNRR